MYRRLYILLIIGSCWAPSFGQETVSQDTIPRDTIRTDSVPPYSPSFFSTFNPTYRFGDPFANQTSKSAFFLPDPSNLDLQIDYDTSGFQYTIFERLGDLNFRPVTTMSFREYDEYNDSQLTQNYWREKSIGLDGESAVSGRRLIPKLYLSPAFDRIFGGSYVDITPTGFINLDFGGNWQNIDNPAIPQRQQRNGGFNFEQQISMNLIGRIGEKLEISANFDNNNTFDFQNNMRIEYTGYDEEIIKKIIIGNVSMPVSNSLMTGSQTLFGLKTELQFGDLYFTGVASRQQGKVATDCIGSSGDVDNPSYNPSTDLPSVRASAYDENKHFFLAHFFRDKFEEWMNDPLNIISGLNITNVEVYVTNSNNETQLTKNMVGFMDLAESSVVVNSSVLNGSANEFADNSSNALYANLIASGYRSSDQIYNNLISLGLDPASEFVETKTASQLEEGVDFIVNRQLGYISLTRNLADNQSLAVAYQYTWNGAGPFTVGELSSERRLNDDESIFLKLLRPNSVDPDLPTWDLMMKNIYHINGASNNPDDFTLRINYRDDASGIDNPYLHEGGAGIENEPLIELLGLDQYNRQNDPNPDGYFDFISGVTINTDRDLLIFPVLEPFGSTLQGYFNERTQVDLIDKYVYDELYDLTQQEAQAVPEKDKFRIAYSGTQGRGSTSNTIDISGFAITPGSVTVTMGSVTLEEGRHYTVDYTLGRVTITDQSLLNSSADICVQSESANVFDFQTTWFYGGRLDYRIDENFNIGASILHLNERRGGITRFPVGNEPMRNTKYGFDISVTEESRFLTKAVDAIPLISTKEPSEISFSAEYAKFIPGTSNEIDGDPTSTIEDFENAASPLALNGWNGWRLAATPETNNASFFNQTGGLPGRDFNFKKAKIAWYTVDRSVFYQSSSLRPDNLSDEELQNHYVRAVLPQEIFPQRDPGQVQLNESLLDIAYFPSERGQQNYTTDLLSDGRLANPAQNWAGISTGFEQETNFVQSNFQYIEFWMMDPFIDGPRGVVLDGVENQNNTTGGELVFNLGNISEDVVPDGSNFFENGLPENGDPAEAQINADWGRTPSGQYLTGFFTNDATARANQDVGFDGLRDDEEADFFADFVSSVPGGAFAAVSEDVSADNFQYFTGEALDSRDANIIERYKNFNGTDGNSPFNSGNDFTPASNILPDKEDINEDNTISFLEEYFEYSIPLEKNQIINSDYVVDQIQDASGEATWYQFRIPLEKFTGTYGDPDFKNIRFMRMYLTGWEQPVVLRFAQFQLTRSTWRKYESSLRDPGLGEIPEPKLNDFEISVVNVEENSTGSPTQPPYVVPPGLQRDINNAQVVNTRYNEQSLQLCVENLENGDARAAFRTQTIDLVNYDRIEMFLHAHSYGDGFIQDNDVNAFIRFGQDNSLNFYEIEVPLVLTEQGLSTSTGGLARLVWPSANEINLSIDLLKAVKVERNRRGIDIGVPYSTIIPNTNYRVTVLGNPELNSVESMMIGIRNPDDGLDDDGLAKSVCIWANDFRAVGYENQNGWAANAALQAKLADLARVNLNTRFTSIGYGALNTTIAQRNRFESFGYQASANVNLEKFLYPKKTGLVVPMFVNYERDITTPQYDPLNQDILLEESLRLFEDEAERDEYERLMQSNTVSRGINFSNVRKTKVKEDAKNRVYDIENFSFTYAYSDETSSNHFTKSRFRKNVTGSVNYDYAPVAISFEPFAKSEKLTSPYLQLIKDLNFSPLPSGFSFSANLNRSYTRTQFFDDNLEGLDPNFERLFNFNRVYSLRWNFFKSLSFDYNANVRAVIDEPDGIIQGDINTKEERDYIWGEILNLGRMKTFDQNVNFTYKLPLDKIPFTNWLSVDARYTGGYNWTAGALNQTDQDGNTFGNLLSNRRDQGMNGKIDMVKLYDKVTFLNKANKATPEERSLGQKLLMPLMSLRSINATYNVRESTNLTGFTPTVFLLGMDSSFNAPGWAFILGSQDPHIRFQAANNGWLTNSPYLTAPFMQSKGTDFKITGNILPFDDLSIQLDFSVSNQSGYQEIFRYDADSARHVSFTPSRSGSYSISFMTIRTAFEPSRNDNFSSAFAQFEENLGVIHERLSSINPNVIGDVRYDTLSQDVLIPAFLAAYSGGNAESYRLNPFPKIPIPNWRVDYNGLMRIPIIEELFSSFTVSHGYRSVYTVGNFNNNLRYADPNGLTLNNSIRSYPLASEVDDITNQLVPAYVINQVVISEQFAPLIGVNVRTKSNLSTRLEFKKERNLSLNMSNAQVTETTNNDVTFDFGYSKVGFKIPWRFSGRTVTLPNNITFRTSFTIRDSRTIQRKINGESLITNGSFSYQVRPMITYEISNQLNFTMYFDRSVTDPKILSSFKRSTTSFGFQLRFDLSSDI